MDKGLTGANRAHPGLDRAIVTVRKGVTLVVPKLDRLVRSFPMSATSPNSWRPRANCGASNRNSPTSSKRSFAACTRIREQGLFVIGIGKPETPKPFVNACGIFVYTTNLYPKNKATAKPKKKGWVGDIQTPPNLLLQTGTRIRTDRTAHG